MAWLSMTECLNTEPISLGGFNINLSKQKKELANLKIGVLKLSNLMEIKSIIREH